MDPDSAHLNGKPELTWVNDKIELSEWIREGYVTKPKLFESITSYGVQLHPGDSIEVLFKFLTVREVSLA